MGTPQYVSIEDDDSIADCFARRVAKSSEDLAYREFDAREGRWKTVTWREVAVRAGRVRAALASEGLVAGDRVAIMLRNGLEWVAFDQGALAHGLVVVPLYADDRPDNIAYILEDSGAQVLFIEGAEHLKKIAEIRARIPGVKRIVCVKPLEGGADPRVRALDDWWPAQPAVAAPVKTGGNAISTIVYTSGTPGRPKGVALSHRHILQNVKSCLAVYAVYRDDVFLSFLPLSHMLERTVGYYLTMAAGAVVAFARSIAQLSEDFKSVQPTVIVSVPRIFERLHGAIQATLQSSTPMKRRLFEAAHQVGWDVFQWHQGRAGWKLSFLAWPLLRALVAAKLLERLGGRRRLCISGGAPLKTQIAHTFIGLGLPICQGYGLTEASPVVSVNHLARNDPASIGMPLPGVEVSFGDNSALRVRGPNVMLGYWKNPEASAKVKSEDGWLETGDQARMADGFLYITGRIKEIIVLANGEKVPPVDMELAIQLDPLFEHVMIVGEGKPYLSALVVINGKEWQKVAPAHGLPADPLAAERPDVEKFMAGRIAAQIKGFPGYAQVRRVAIVADPWTVDNGLLTPTLKLRRNEILARSAERIDELYRGRAA